MSNLLSVPLPTSKSKVFEVGRFRGGLSECIFESELESSCVNYYCDNEYIEDTLSLPRINVGLHVYGFVPVDVLKVMCVSYYKFYGNTRLF